MQSTTRWSKVILAAVVAGVGLQGCASMAVSNFQPAPTSGQGKGSAMLYLHETETYVPASDPPAWSKDLQAALASCGTKSSDKVAPAFVAAVVPVVGKLLFDMYMDKRARDLDALKAAAEKSYHGRMVLSVGAMQQAVKEGRCLVLTRTSEEKEAPGKEVLDFIAVLALEGAPKGGAADPAKAFVFKPIYVAASSAVAVTQRGSKPSISVSFALSVRGIGKQQNGLPAFAQVGEAAVTVPELYLSAPSRPVAACSTGKGCPASDALAMVSAPQDSVLVLGVGVTEVGNVGVDFDAAKSELSAIKAAIGPLISDVLTEKLK